MIDGTLRYTAGGSYIIRRILKMLIRAGYLIEEWGMSYLAEADSERAATGGRLPYPFRSLRLYSNQSKWSITRHYDQAFKRHLVELTF